MSAMRFFVLSCITFGMIIPACAQVTTGPRAPVAMPAMGKSETDAMMDSGILAHGILDQFEGRIGGAENAFRWDGQAWIGTDRDKLWLKSEGFVFGAGGVGDGRHELLYDRAISTYADLQVGVRTDWDSGTNRTWAAFGLQGLAPLYFNYEATGYLSDRGHAALRLAASYDLLITQQLILQPEAEMNFYSKADPGSRTGSGLADIDAGIRLRYEINRKFAPYVGVAYVGRFGQTAKFARKEGEAAGVVQFVFGIRSWF